ncbi:DUF6328 family protein [Streptomyces sp. HUAS TT3]|uniref:DUF6328 family protein n=1 Tax=Streptomyces sp. HUAS TT3 TaxID=3447510 RepID=UPI003F660692
MTGLPSFVLRAGTRLLSLRHRFNQPGAAPARPDSGRPAAGECVRHRAGLPGRDGCDAGQPIAAGQARRPGRGASLPSRRREAVSRTLQPRRLGGLPAVRGSGRRRFASLQEPRPPPSSTAWARRRRLSRCPRVRSASPPVPGVGLPGPGIRPSQPRHAGLTRPATHPAARGSAKSRPGRPLNERPLRPAPRNVGQRRETCDERADRLWLEMVYEVRVLLTAVQLLFAFFLPVACCAGRVRWRH